MKITLKKLLLILVLLHVALKPTQRSVTSDTALAICAGAVMFTAAKATKKWYEFFHDSRTPLHLAASNGNLKRAKYLSNAYINHADADGHTPLDIALRNNNLEMARILCHHEADVNRAKTVNGHTLLGAAVVGEDLEKAKLLLKFNADANLISGGQSPLIWAVVGKTKSMVRILVDSRANVNHEDAHGQTPLDIALRNDNLEIARLLCDYGANLNQVDADRHLVRALDTQNQEMARLLCDHGASVNQAKTVNGHTLLGAAVVGEDLEKAKLLLKFNADANLISGGQSPLIWAVVGKTKSMVQILVDSRANVNHEDAHGPDPSRHCPA